MNKHSVFSVPSLLASAFSGDVSNLFAVLTILMLFLSFALFMTALFARRKRWGKRVKILFFVAAACALILFMIWGITRNF